MMACLVSEVFPRSKVSIGFDGATIIGVKRSASHMTRWLSPLQQQTTIFLKCQKRSSIYPIVSRRIYRHNPCNSHHQLRQSSDVAASSSSLARIGIGGSKLASSPAHAEQYTSVVQTALSNGVTTFEAAISGWTNDQHGNKNDDSMAPEYLGGERALVEAYKRASAQISASSSEAGDASVTFTARFGYRTISAKKDNNNTEGVESSCDMFENDVDVGGQTFANVGANEGGGRPIHNLSKDFLQACLSESPLVQLRRNSEKENMNLIYMAHNPEVQATTLLGDGGSDMLEDARLHVKEKLTEAFEVLEKACADDVISSYGVSSNGLSLPDSHPMHLKWMDVLQASSDAAAKIHGTPTIPKLSTIQLPANLLETNGLSVARQVRSFLKEQNDTKPDDKKSDENDDSSNSLQFPTSINVHTSRPLTCYPDGGTGNGHPFKLVDYQMSTNPIAALHNDLASAQPQWTHLMDGPPPVYSAALNQAMGHFDAEHILEIQAKGERALSVEERETLEGCRLLQSMLHDLDRKLETVRSFASYEEELYGKVIPLIHETFDGLDDDSSEVLQNFFMAHGSAVRYAVAHTTRKLLKEGGEGVSPYDIPPETPLQTFALQWLWEQLLEVDEIGGGASKVIVGCSQPWHVLDAIRAASRSD